MSLLDGILSKVGANVDIASLAAKVGLSPEMTEMAVGALARAHPQPGDTVDTAAAQTGVEPGILSQIVSHLGGEGGLGQLSSVLHSDDHAGILGKLGGLFGGGDAAGGEGG